MGKFTSFQKILYDFTVNAGDTIFNVYYEVFWSNEGNIIEEYIVNSVQTVNLDGIDRIVVDDMWYEGIGNRQGLFLEPWINISMYTVKLECHSVNGLGVYPNVTTEPCPMNLSLIDNSNLIGIYPNPVNEQLQVESAESIDSYRIFDCVGKEFQGTKTFTSTIDVSNLVPGLYQIEFSNSKGKTIRSFYKN
jgi:Secretion system C-terminal sorting domain